MLGRSESDEVGWDYNHMFSTTGDEYLQGEWFNETIGTVTNHPLGPHVHIDWVDLQNVVYAGGQPINIYRPGYLNPFDSLPVGPTYDYVMFDTVNASGQYPNPSGLQVVTDAYSSDFVMNLNDQVWGIVDLVVAPFSAYLNDPLNDSCGVRVIEWRMLRQDPYTGEFNLQAFPLEQRTVFDMSGYFPENEWFPGSIDPCFAKLYSHQDEHYQPTYTITNCSNEQVEDTCFSNIWTEEYSRNDDWQDGVLCRGAWDTRLGLNEVQQESWTNASALIPDGRYCVSMYAESQGSRNSATAHLPVYDLALPLEGANIMGMIVDNFRPNVESVMIYHAPDFDLMYTANWNTTYGDTYRGLSSDESYYSPPDQNYLCAAIKFSEHMDPDKLPDVWLTAGWADKEIWSSVGKRRATWFIPCEWDSVNLGPMPFETDGSYWQCYRREKLIEPGYNGRLLVNIGDHPVVPFGAGVDLNRNLIDGDPSTVCGYREDLPSSAWEDWGNYENPGMDSSYSWGDTPFYTRVSAKSVIGTCLNETFKVDIGKRCLRESEGFLQPSPYWCGFWLIDHTPSDSTEQIPVFCVDPKGIFVRYEGFGEYYMEYDNVEYPPDAGNTSSHLTITHLSSSGRYLWLGINNLYTYTYATNRSNNRGIVGDASGWVQCIDSQTGLVLNQEIIDGYRRGAPMGMLNASSITSITEANGDTVKVVFFESLQSSPPYGVVDSVYLAPPSSDILLLANLDDPQHDEEMQIELTDISPQFDVSIMSNPSHGDIAFTMFGVLNRDVLCSVYDISGRLLESELYQPSSQTQNAIIDLDDYFSGIVFLLFESDEERIVHKVTLINP